jgi:predicted house-cleaning noncanonical NTP pyrophosphatase (MazG superfamily)
LISEKKLEEFKEFLTGKKSEELDEDIEPNLNEFNKL